MQLLFTSAGYLQAARTVCRGRTTFDPIQLNLILMVPGQELPMHLDVPWFWGATRFTLPQVRRDAVFGSCAWVYFSVLAAQGGSHRPAQWLLVVMEHSGLFEERSVPQIQGVAWLREQARPGGEFFFYPEGPYAPSRDVPSKYNTAIVADGCRVVHGVDRYQPGVAPPPIVKNAANELRYAGDDHWELHVDGTKRAEYTSDVRRRGCCKVLTRALVRALASA